MFAHSVEDAAIGGVSTYSDRSRTHISKIQPGSQHMSSKDMWKPS